ncbi:hypothetical protein ACFSQE_08135 [Vogesella fluminis]|uniref:hypothetical protein n=1 Tax=Vogesella fluminis TaxID=1069161 RepID=UPI00363594FF
MQAPDGNEAYTRDGGYIVDNEGVMRTRSGLAILGKVVRSWCLPVHALPSVSTVRYRPLPVSVPTVPCRCWVASSWSTRRSGRCTRAMTACSASTTARTLRPTCN